MRNIRRELFRYVEAKRHLWNTYFVGQVTDLTACDPLDSFEIIDRRLFYALVCHPLGIDFDPLMGTEEVDRILVQPRSNIHDIPLMVAKPERGYWNETHSFPAKQLSLVYKEFFQWNVYDFLTLSTVKCKIIECESHPQYLGRDVLVEHHFVDFCLKP